MTKKNDGTDNPFMDMFENFGRNMNMPTVDIEKLMEHHRKNLEALEKSTRSFASGTTSVMEKQREILERGLQQISEIAQSYKTPEGVQDVLSKQVEFARESFEKALKDTGELAGIVKESGGDTVNIWRERVEEIVADVRAAVEKQTGRKS